jgi:hypothetical protein
LLNVKLTTVAPPDTKATRIQTVEFAKSETAVGNLPNWLLDVATTRYLENAGSYYKNESCAVEAAPNHDTRAL